MVHISCNNHIKEYIQNLLEKRQKTKDKRQKEAAISTKNESCIDEKDFNLQRTYEIPKTRFKGTCMHIF